MDDLYCIVVSTYGSSGAIYKTSKKIHHVNVLHNVINFLINFYCDHEEEIFAWEIKCKLGHVTNLATINKFLKEERPSGDVKIKVSEVVIENPEDEYNMDYNEINISFSDKDDEYTFSNFDEARDFIKSQIDMVCQKDTSFDLIETPIDLIAWTRTYTENIWISINDIE